MKKIYVTGGTGFIGQHLIEDLLRQGYFVTTSVRKTTSSLPIEVKQDLVGENFQTIDWQEKLETIDTVIHLAGNSGLKKNKENENYLHKTNVEFTESLALAAAKAGVKLFIFLSSIKVNGECSSIPYTENDVPQPNDDYARSKLLAEQKLLKIAEVTELEVLILRPSLVYGKGAKGNFQTLIRLIDLKMPLPFGNIKNKRSLCSVQNLCHFILTCLTISQVANEIYLVADAESLSTTDLFSQIARAKEKSVFLVPVPEVLMKLFLLLIGKKSIADRLFGSLEVNISKAQKQLNWVPPLKPKEAFELTFKEK